MPPISTSAETIAMIGFGEAAQAFVSGWDRQRAPAITAYDIKAALPEWAETFAARYQTRGVEGRATPAEAVVDAGLVFSLVTADQSLVAAQSAAPHLRAGALWFDCNSCSPQTKRAAAQVIEAAGGRYIDVAVMAPVYPARHHTPLLVAGLAAAAAADALRALDMRPTVTGPRVGDASSIKMIRSVMMKGMEALTAECLLAARRAGVEDAVLDSLQKSNPDIDWRARSHYHLERMMVHGKRRAAEMGEVAVTLADLGLPNRMAAATAEWQQQVGDLELSSEMTSIAERTDAILDLLRPERDA